MSLSPTHAFGRPTHAQPEERRLPQAWPETGDRRRMADGDELEERRLLLDQAGFGEVTVEAAYTGAVATPDDTWLAFVARKES